MVLETHTYTSQALKSLPIIKIYFMYFVYLRIHRRKLAKNDLRVLYIFGNTHTHAHTRTVHYYIYIKYVFKEFSAHMFLLKRLSFIFV